MTTATGPGPESRAGWPAAAAPGDYVLGGVRAVLPDAVIDEARVVVRGGLIVEAGPAPGGSAADVDGGGLLCVPGLIDVHSDALEGERAPRPSALLPWEFAVVSLEAKLRSAGITTAFHGAGFQTKQASGLQRTVGSAVELCTAIDARAAAPDPLVDHRVLYRLDVRSADGAEALAGVLASREAAGPASMAPATGRSSVRSSAPGEIPGS